MDGRGSEARARDRTVVTRTREVGSVSLSAFLSAFDAPRTLWVAPDEPAVAGCGAAATVGADGDGDRFRAVRRAAEDLFAAVEGRPDRPEIARPRLFGGFSFHDEHRPAPPWEGFEAAHFVLPALQVTRGDRTWLTVTAVDPDEGEVEERLAAAAEAVESLPAPGEEGDGATRDPPGVSGRKRAVSRSAWREGVESALERIDGGDLRKVVLAQALAVDLAGELSVPAAIERLGEVYPDCYRFLAQPGSGEDPPSFFGATPERLVSLRGRTVETEALAGSTGRGDTPEEDEWLAAELAESQKDCHEHDLVVDAVRDQLDPLASSMGVGPRSVRRLANVQHLRTPIAAELADSEHVLSLVEALHPTPAVGGLPPDRALATIRETEPFERGWYAAPVGWFDAAGDGSFAVAIRSAVARRRRATLFAGAGIVADSDPDREWDEVQLKYRPILDVLE